jgi:hypothetical protein
MIDAATVREQFQRFSRQWDDNSLLADYADLLRRYLSQPLSEVEVGLRTSDFFISLLLVARTR